MTLTIVANLHFWSGRIEGSRLADDRSTLQRLGDKLDRLSADSQKRLGDRDGSYRRGDASRRREEDSSFQRLGDRQRFSVLHRRDQPQIPYLQSLLPQQLPAPQSSQLQQLPAPQLQLQQLQAPQVQQQQQLQQQLQTTSNLNSVVVLPPEKTLITKDLLKCTANRTIWWFGNSVSRGHFFAAISLLGNRPEIGIEEQKRRCGRGGKYLAQRYGQGSCFGLCTCSEQLGNLRLAFVWQQRVFDELIGAALEGKGSDPLTNVASGDVVFLNAGTDDIFVWHSILKVKNISIAAFEKAGLTWDSEAGKAEVKILLGIPDIKGKLSRSEVLRLLDESLLHWRHRLKEVPSLQQAIHRAALSGRRIIWRSSTRMCDRFQWDGSSVATINKDISESNRILKAAMESIGVPVADVRASIYCPRSDSASKTCSCDGYLDAIHPDQAESKSQVQQMLQVACQNA